MDELDALAQHTLGGLRWTSVEAGPTHRPRVEHERFAATLGFRAFRTATKTTIEDHARGPGID